MTADIKGGGLLQPNDIILGGALPEPPFPLASSSRTPFLISFPIPGERTCDIYRCGAKARKKFTGTTEAARAAAAQQPHLLGAAGGSPQKAGQRRGRVSGRRPLLGSSGEGSSLGPGLGPREHVRVRRE